MISKGFLTVHPLPAAGHGGRLHGPCDMSEGKGFLSKGF